MVDDLYPEKVVHLIAPSSIEHVLKRLIRHSEASGFTFFNVKGEGDSGFQSGQFEGDTNVLFLVILPAEKMPAFLDLLVPIRRQGHHLTVFVTDAQVMTPDEFSRPLRAS